MPAAALGFRLLHYVSVGCGCFYKQSHYSADILVDSGIVINRKTRQGRPTGGDRETRKAMAFGVQEVSTSKEDTFSRGVYAETGRFLP